jgi:hypothetical protein
MMEASASSNKNNYMILSNTNLGSHCTDMVKTVLPPFLIIGCFGFSKFIDIIMHLDIYYISMCIAKTMHLEK